QMKLESVGMAVRSGSKDYKRTISRSGEHFFSSLPRNACGNISYFLTSIKLSYSMSSVVDHLNVQSYPMLLAALSSDAQGAPEAYLKLRCALVRFFQLKGVDDAEKAADETVDRVSAKLGEGVLVQDPVKYSFGVARLVFLEDLRKTEKTKKALREFRSESERLSVAGDEDYYAHMRECFTKLSETNQTLLRSYFADLPRTQLDEQRRQIALGLGGSVNSVRLKIFRLRRQLEDCVRSKLLRVD
ncbi:MAG TPA: hypothetical protein VMZ26_08115, partial [Pyrinomonadaceae bacterium]|nr:hypothetical protein [Pyrinomonadaceae bacterium]